MGAGWNRPSEDPKKVARKPSLWRGVIAGLIVVLVAGAYFVFFFDANQAPRKSSSNTNAFIPEVQPALAPTNKVVVAKKPQVEIKTLPNGKLMKYVDGKEAWLFPRAPDSKVVITNFNDESTATIEVKTFKCSANRMIAFMLTTTPGEGMVGDARDYFRNFNRSFEKSKSVPIEILPTDTPEQRELKLSVIDVRKELEARQKAGEDLETVMINTFDEFQRLALYRSEIEKQITDVLKKHNDFTEDDMNDLLGAANQMLADRGCDAIKMPALMRRMVRISRAKQAAAAAEQQQTTPTSERKSE